MYTVKKNARFIRSRRRTLATLGNTHRIQQKFQNHASTRVKDGADCLPHTAYKARAKLPLTGLRTTCHLPRPPSYSLPLNSFRALNTSHSINVSESKHGPFAGEKMLASFQYWGRRPATVTLDRGTKERRTATFAGFVRKKITTTAQDIVFTQLRVEISKRYTATRLRFGQLLPGLEGDTHRPQ